MATPMIEIVVVQGTLKSAIKSMHWKVDLKQQVQLLFSIYKRGNLYVQKGFSLIFEVCGQTNFLGGVCPLMVIFLSCFVSDSTSTLTMTVGNGTLPLVNSIVALQGPYSFAP